MLRPKVLNHAIKKEKVQYQQRGEARAYATIYYSSVIPAALPPLLSINVCPRGTTGNEFGRSFIVGCVCVCITL